MIGKRLGDYEIIREIGEGGQGDVYLAKNVHLPGVNVVLKILKSIEQKARFLREATTLAKLEHRNICQMKHFFTFENNLILVMQYVDGKTLKDLITDREQIELVQIQQIFIQVLDALIYAHKHGVTHRDIKPSNIMIDKKGVVKIIDFGIARDIADPRLTTTGTSAGTPQYMAPEQFTDEKIEDFTPCDIYSAGVSLYESCCGVLPFVDTNPYILKEKHCKEDPIVPSKHNPHVSNSLEKVILTAMKKKPGRRYSTVEAMRHALSTASVDESTATEIFVGSRKHARIAGIAVLALIVVSLVFAVEAGLIHLPSFASSPKLQIQSQTIDEGGTFAPIYLDSLTENNPNLAGATWTFAGNHELTVDMTGGRISVLSPNPDWFGSENITFLATTTDGVRDSTMARYTVNNVNDSPVLEGRTYQRITEGGHFPLVRLDDLVSDVDDPDSTILWNWRAPGSFTVTQSGLRTLQVAAREGWVGSDTLLLLARDKAGASDSIKIRYEVNPGSAPPAGPPTYAVRLSVVPPGSMIYYNKSQEFQDVATLTLSKGTYGFDVLNREYPIRRVTLKVNSESVDTMIDLSKVYEGTDQGTLGVAVWRSDEVIPLKIILNRFDIGKLSMEDMFNVLAGEYELGVDLGDTLQLDSLSFDGRRLSSSGARITVRAGVRNLMKFYVSEKE